MNELNSMENEMVDIDTFSDLQLNINPHNFYYHKMFQINKIWDKETSLEIRKAEFILNVELFEDMVESADKITEEYDDEIEQLAKELNQDAEKISDQKKKYNFVTYEIPLRIAREKYKQLIRMVMFDSQPITGALKDK